MVLTLEYFISGSKLEELSLWVTGLEVHSQYLLPNQALLPNAGCEPTYSVFAVADENHSHHLAFSSLIG